MTFYIVFMASQGYSLNGFLKFQKTKFTQLTKGIIGNYHYGLNIEHDKPVSEKGLIVKSLLGDIPTDTKQAAGMKEGLLASLYMYPRQI